MKFKSQSAMEYLMTYGWAILIIAVVLGVLLQFNIFSSNALTPKAQPGSCQVTELSSGIHTLRSLSGTCTNELPEYVAAFSGSGVYISGYSSNSLITAYTPSMSGSNVPFTVSMWIYTSSNAQNYNMPFFGIQSYQGFELFRSGFGTATAQLGLHRCSAADTNANIGPVISLNKWYFVAVAVDPPNYYFQLDSNSTTESNGNVYYGNGNIVIGTQSAQCDGEIFAGYLSNVQLYNTSLSASDVQSLYLEGIGGVPININYLVGWWPLNGNANDYSGNGDNGQIQGGVSFNGSWSGSYTAP